MLYSKCLSATIVAAVLICGLLAPAVRAEAGQDFHWDGEFNANPACTRGRLFVTENLNGRVHVHNLDDGFAEVGNFASSAPGGLFVYPSETGKNVFVVNQGNANMNYSDGAVAVFSSGLNGPAAATVVERAHRVTCVRPIHFTSTYGWVSIFCDGVFNRDINFNVNSSAVYMNEAHLSDGQTVDQFTWNLPGQQHGVSWALDEDHFLYSVPTPARVGRASTSSLPDGFLLAFRNRSIVHSLNTFDTQSSCAGFHGESHVGSTFAFGCDSPTDSTHDGILVVEKNEQTETYTSKKLAYPTILGVTARTGTIASNPHSGWFVGNFGTSFVLAFNGKETSSIAPNMALNITGSCGWGLDESFQSYFFMLHTSGVLRAYTISSTGFTLFRSVRVFNEPVVCTNNFAIKGGFGTAIIARRDVPSIIVVNLPLGTFVTQPLSYTPFNFAVGGEPKDFCAACPTCQNGRGQLSGSALSAVSIGLPLLAALAAVAQFATRML